MHDAEAQSPITGTPTGKIIAEITWFNLDGVLMLSPGGTVMIAKWACSKNPIPVRKWIIKWEKIKGVSVGHKSHRPPFR